MIALYIVLYIFTGIVVGAILCKAATEIKRKDDPFYTLPRGAMAWIALLWPMWLAFIAIAQAFQFIGYCTQKLVEAADKEDS